MGAKLGVIIGIIIVALLIPSAHASAPSCPPDIAIKWYALVNYLAYASGQNSTQLIAEAQATGNFTVTISGVKLVVPYCSLNATAANGSKLVFAPAVGAGELKKLGLNITQAKAVFQKLKNARDQAMRNLDRFLKPLENLGLDNATRAISMDKGYGIAAEANLKAAALLKEVAELLEKVGANETAVYRLITAARIHEEVAQSLLYLNMSGGLAGLEERAALKISAALVADKGYFNASRAMAEAGARLSALANALARVNATAVGALLKAASLLNNTAFVLSELGEAGGINAMNREAAANVTSALNGTIGVNIAISNVQRALAYLDATLQLLKEVNASGTAVLKVEEAMAHHEKALEVLKTLGAAGGAAGVEQNVYEALMMGRSLNPNVVALCIDLNITEILARYPELGVNVTTPLLKYDTMCEIVKLLDWQYYANKTKRGIEIPMQKINLILLALRGYVNLYGGINVFRNIGIIRVLYNYIVSLKASVFGQAAASSQAGSAQVSVGISASGEAQTSGNVTMKGGWP